MQCLDYLENQHNHECFLWAKEKMSQGESMEQWMGSFFSPKIQSYLVCFLKFLSLQQALELSVTLYDQKETDQKELIKMTGYPIVMFLFSLIGVQLFCAFCMPSLIEMMKEFDVSTFAVEGIYRVLMLVAMMLTMMICLVSGVMFYFCLPEHVVSGIELLHRYHLGFLIQKECSSHFAMLYYHCVRMGVPTRTALMMLKNCTTQPVTQFLAEQVDTRLNHGTDLVEAVGIDYLDPSFQKLMKTVVLSNDAMHLLEGYLKVADVKRKKRYKQAAQVIQMIAYVMIAIMIILVYQVLFLPLSMLERM